MPRQPLSFCSARCSIVPAVVLTLVFAAPTASLLGQQEEGPVVIPPRQIEIPAVPPQAQPVQQAQPIETEEDAEAIPAPPAGQEDPTAVERTGEEDFQTLIEQAMEGKLPTETRAVEIPTEMLEDSAEGEEKEQAEVAKMIEDATIEEKIDAEDSVVNKIDMTRSAVPTNAVDLRAKSQPEKPGQLGSSILTRTEARTFTFSIPAPRGQILDRNGYPLAQSKVSYYAAIAFPYLGEDVKDEIILQYAGERIIHVNNILRAEWDLDGKTVVEHYRERRWFPLTFSSVLNDLEIDELNRQKMEGLVLHPIYLRHYPQQQILAHVLGYVGKRPPRTTGPIVRDEPLWGLGMGVDGLEEAFETDLRGTPGRVNVLFEADGSKVKEDVLSRPRPGFNVVTSIDLEMQQICERLLQKHIKRGAMVVMDTRTGDILAMASYPSFDPNEFIPSISQEKYSELVNDPEKPLFPRAYRAVYPPASTFKVPVALAYLDSGFITPSDLYSCPPGYTIGNLTMNNWNSKGEGMMNVVGAITRSCNTWFYQVAINGGGDTMSAMATRLGMGMKTGIPLNEAEGFIPSNRWHLQEFGYAMSDGDEAVMSIGQGRVGATPLQIARMMAAVGNGVQVLKPRLVLQVQNLNHEIQRSFPVEVNNTLNVDPYALSAVRKGMYDVVNAGNGTGRAAGHRITVAGKTGTGQWKVAQKQNIAWFAGFAPARYPVLSFAVIYEGDPGEVVSGGKNGAPVIGEFFEEYLSEENYTKVYDASQKIQEEMGELGHGYVAAPVTGSIFRDADAEAEFEELAREGEEEEFARPGDRPERPQTGNSGLFKRLFNNKRR